MTIGTEKPKYRILISLEERKLEKIRNELKWDASHITLIKGSSGYLTPVIKGENEYSGGGFDLTDFRRELSFLIERTMNGSGKLY